MAGIFSTIRRNKPKKNRFNLSHEVKSTAKFGELIPFFCTPVVPGDVFKLNMECLSRFAPFQFPVMNHVKMYTHFFFVPNRLIWTEWEKFITGGEDGTTDPSDLPYYPRLHVPLSFTFPTIVTNDITSDNPDYQYVKDGSLMDYLGFPSINGNDYSKYWNGMTDNGLHIDELPFRAYQLIYNEYYRDQNLDPEIDIHADYSGETGVNSTTLPILRDLMTIRKRAWKKDYFTSALPWAQRGEEVELPLMGSADLLYNTGALTQTNVRSIAWSAFHNTRSEDSVDFSSPAQGSPLFRSDGTVEDSTGSRITFGTKSSDGVHANLGRALINSSSISPLIKGVDLSKVSSSTINELRRAIKAQEFLELRARGGSRYIEQIESFFGVKSSDARLQRPEFLGGGKSDIIISDVLQTSETTNSSALGTPGGTGVGVQRTHSFKRGFEEHGLVIGIMSFVPDATYQQGVSRLFNKFDPLEYYWPQFAHLGEQEIKQSEIFYTGNSKEDDKVFGYTPRYAEYKYMPSTVHGDFRGSLQNWHMGRIFSAPPSLNSDFLHNIQDAADRPFAVQDAGFDKIWCNIRLNISALRPMPKYGTPLF